MAKNTSLLTALRRECQGAMYDAPAVAHTTQVIFGNVYAMESDGPKCKVVTIGGDTGTQTVYLWSDKPQCQDNWNIQPGERVIWDVYQSQSAKYPGFKLWDYYKINDKLNALIQQRVDSYYESKRTLKTIQYFLDQLCEEEREKRLLISAIEHNQNHNDYWRKLCGFGEVVAGTIAVAFGNGFGAVPIGSGLTKLAHSSPDATLVEKQHINRLLNRMSGMRQESHDQVRNQSHCARIIQDILTAAKANKWKPSKGSNEVVSTLLLPERTIINASYSVVQ